MSTRIYIANLGKYNEGYLVGGWIDLPFSEDEKNNLMVKIGLGRLDEDGEYQHGVWEDGCCYEEWAIHDYETDINGLKIGEYDNIDELNEKIESIENFDKYEIQALGALLNHGYDFDDAVEHVTDGDYIVFPGCSSMADVAEQYADEVGLLNSIPENLRMYFDFEAYGRDMGFEGTFVETDDGYIQIY